MVVEYTIKFFLFGFLGPLVCKSFSNRAELYLAGIVSHGEGRFSIILIHNLNCKANQQFF
jgi:hypothetical protein